MEDTVYWIMLQNALGYGSPHTESVSEYFGSPRGFFDAGEERLRLWGRLTEKRLDRVLKTERAQAEKILDRCRELGISVVTPNSPQYPRRLREIKDNPAVLYVKGELPNIDSEVCVAIVDSRNVTGYGAAVTDAIAGELAQGGALVVSGGALGVDSIAHKAALKRGKKTVAVLGCGINSRYLAKNIELREVIAANGALISEYPPDTPAGPHTFPQRNRIISGLCLATVVIEAGAHSGSLITARHAKEQGRDVFAATGSAISDIYDGTNDLLRHGARPVFNAIDVLSLYAERFPDKIDLETLGRQIENERKQRRARQANGGNRGKEENKKSVTLPNDLSDAAASIAQALKNGAKTKEQLVNDTKIPVFKVLSGLTELEMADIIKCVQGKYELNMS